MQKIKQDIGIGHNLRKLRNSHEKKQDDIAAMLSVNGFSISRSTYSRYETSELNIPIRVLVLLKKYYNCHYDDFFEGLE